MSNGFNDAKKSIDLSSLDLSSFNEPVSNGSFFEVGVYDVSVESVEVKDFGFGESLIISWANNEGASIKQFINMFFTDRDTGKKTLSTKYVILSRIFSSNVATRNTFFLETAMKDTSKFNALKGLKANIVVSKGKKGYDIVIDPSSGAYIVSDVATKETLLDGKVFPSMSEANQAAKDAALKRAFNEVTRFNAIESEVENNERSLCAALEASESPKVAATLQQASML